METEYSRKYRVFEKEFQQYLSDEYADQICLRPDGKLFWYDMDTGLFLDMTGKVIVEFFIGLCDALGKPIYSGDVMEDDKGRILRVVWCEKDDNCYNRSHFTRWEFEILSPKVLNNYAVLSPWFEGAPKVTVISDIHKYKADESEV